MLDFLKKIILPQENNTKTPEILGKRLMVATAVLLIEMAQSDKDFADVEMKTIQDILINDVGVSPDNLQNLLSMAQKEQSEAVEFWQYSSLINENYTPEEKIKVIEQVWRVVYADGVVDAYEDQMIRTLAHTLHISHKDLIDAKLRVKEKYIG